MKQFLSHFYPPHLACVVLFIIIVVSPYLCKLGVEWWSEKRLPKSLRQICIKVDDRKSIVRCFASDFRANIPIYRSGDDFYTTYDFEKNKIPSNDTVFVSTQGNDHNDGLSHKSAKLTISAALQTNKHTVILLAGCYRAGVNFANNTALSGINLIGEGKVVVDNCGGNPFNIVGSIYIRNITFVNGNRGSLRTFCKKESQCTYVACKFNNSLVDNENVGKAQSLGGLRVQGGTHYLYRCEASNNGYDGFNYHAAPDGSDNSPHVVEVECRAFDNGIYNYYESNNASTAHDGTHIIRLNCVYVKSHGGIVADVHKGTISFCLGCKASSSMEQEYGNRQFQANYFSASGAVMYLIGCKSAKSLYDLSCFNNASIYTDRDYARKYIGNGQVRILKK